MTDFEGRRGFSVISYGTKAEIQRALTMECKTASGTSHPRVRQIRECKAATDLVSALGGKAPRPRTRKRGQENVRLVYLTRLRRQ